MKNVNPAEVVEIVQKYSPYVSYLSHRYYIKDGTRDDLFEEGVIGILQACKNYKGESVHDEKFNQFVKVCIRRQILDAIKKSNSKKNQVLNDSLRYYSLNDGTSKTVVEDIVDRTVPTNPLDIFIDKEKVEEKKKICEDELTDFEKEVLSLYLGGDKQSEIAKRLGKNVKQIDNTIQRIKSKLSKK